VDTVQTVARLINKALAEGGAYGSAGAAPAPEPFQHLVYMQRRFFS
jgi:hypothetical protein